ncbi:hypothetical protein GCM10008959_30020 [Deinococcus seoulensis]|uniref:Uncharacterized protein n=1 Tax=Deinococcus seoulensis TaxID=1837379 RepID=A0ABQ2RWH9_9DEIO|nr:RusA family crossover junction endodeoxyribonuclease [Deinococcus seoulensis]GGR65694.1 hypothetical protein GCM10008959_30020 [Deinococcus seoulensis]
MNPFPTRQAAEAYLVRIPDAAVRDATRTRLGLTADAAPAPVPVRAPPVQTVAFHASDQKQAPHATLTFTLPFPPSLNSIWRATVITGKDRRPQARILLSQEGRAYRRAVRDVIHALNNPHAPPGARLAVQLTLHSPTRRKFDVDNYAKACLDALTHAHVWADDSLVDELRITRGPVTPGGHVHVAITPLGRTLYAPAR